MFQTRATSTPRQAGDLAIVGVILVLLSFGITMVHSASSVVSATRFGDPFYFSKRQLIWAIIGVLCMFWFSRIDYHVWRKHAPKLAVASFAMLVLVLIVGVNRGGSKAWLGIGSLGIQPSEFAKLGLVVFLAHLLAESADRMHSFWRGFVPPMGLALVAVGLIMLEPDLGQSVVIMGTTVIMLFAAGTRMSHLGALFGVGMLGFGGLVAVAPYRMDRIAAFIDPWKYPLGKGYQIIQSLYALGSGGILGLGLGNSRQKFLYLPEPQTDFIFSIIGEELGLLGGICVLLLFAVLVWRGIRTAIYAPDEFGTLLGVGITGMIAVQVLINIGVVTGSIPATGITLPFISYGGSSLTLLLSGVGILLNISKQAGVVR
ncbi:stage V sporulation protein E [Alicyclobacillus hesperidum URH17-3-68]|uniref:Cell division protein FtsW n=1 Tax=Alicyclobacillus hesperidum TaxID=89784 RepID=A0A1H2V0U0_9BACL|nr:stage V sporulation protein E [Alicyclobacillus hesperidum]EJY55793.1 stage V sporulation protein E [Alicyclobacillus hesperidum URH17-3-68]GLG01116.1 stage V sporulation protein E [Alicyclobacillus hesperidum subsp. aegles]GLV13683.1 stage V sporulation protein E [Alicyclobacillus hesperidum]SDW61514.1 cell division protein FtsW [Alicyclobacillus hesperidum]